MAEDAARQAVVSRELRPFPFEEQRYLKHDEGVEAPPEAGVDVGDEMKELLAYADKYRS
jgi:hypothetical protein